MSRVSDLMQRAQAATSLADFGDDGFREGLQRLVVSADREARLSERGRAGFDLQIVDLLAHRLRVEHWYRLHPEIDEQQIVAPLIGLGLPRTGSTALSCLLAEDPAVRSIRNWEAMAPCPPPETATETSDPRIAIAEQMVQKRHDMFPRKKAMLPSSATMPTECQTFMGHDFKSHLFQALWQVPSYADWLNRDADLVPTYRYVKRVLKLLQWRCPPQRWRLKNPSHIAFIDALHEVFPDARYWMTHRDIGKVLPSVADLYYELMRASSDDVDKHYLGALNSDWCERGMRKVIAFRDAGHEHRFFDIHFAPLQADPFPIIERLYDFLGEDFTPQTRTRMATWRRDTPRDRHGEHRCDAADFGLESARLSERFRFYTERFGVAA
ncbi:MAG TPA: sulfotransferase [Solimonas sp.]|nr:sulfotransferase [Solimonas sp.]